jgi:hypothetical protein
MSDPNSAEDDDDLGGMTYTGAGWTPNFGAPIPGVGGVNITSGGLPGAAPAGSGVSASSPLGNITGVTGILTNSSISAKLTSTSMQATGANGHPTAIVSGGKKEKIYCQYIIVLEDGMCLELDEQLQITPREMIGICKFISVAQTAIGLAMNGHSVNMCWSEFIEMLALERHFTVGLADYNLYPKDSEIIYVFLFDPKP